MTKKNWLPLLWFTATSLGGTASAQWKPDAGMILIGKVVTMNDAGDVLPNARVWLASGKIMAIAKAGESLPDAAKDAVVIDSKGVIYPGMIDLHNHPDYAFYPLLPINKKYRDRFEWRGYDAEFGDMDGFGMEAGAGTQDGYAWQGSIPLAPYSTLILSRES